MNSDRRGFFKRLLGLGAMAVAAPAVAAAEPRLIEAFPVITGSNSYTVRYGFTYQSVSGQTEYKPILIEVK